MRSKGVSESKCSPLLRQKFHVKYSYFSLHFVSEIASVSHLSWLLHHSPPFTARLNVQSFASATPT